MIRITQTKANTKRYRDLEPGDVFEWGSGGYPQKAQAIKISGGMLWLKDATGDRCDYLTYNGRGLAPNFEVSYLGKIKEIIVEK